MIGKLLSQQALLFALLFSTSFVTGNSVWAASIVKSSKVGCSIDLSGRIEPGDHDKFQTLAKTLGLLEPSDSGEPSNSPDDAICLNSPGGSYLEGRLIAQDLRDYGIPTRVPENAECYSSCAFIFMAGRLRGPESDSTSRYLHVKGKLGFHAPYIVPDPKQTFTAADLSNQVTITSQLISDFITFGSDTSPFAGRPFFPVSLLAKLLAASPTELATVATVEDAARWQIDIYGMKKAVKLTENQMRQACANYLEWELDRESKALDSEYTASLKYEKAMRNGEAISWAMIDFGGMYAQDCRVEAPRKPTEGFTICSRDEGNGISRGNCSDGWGSWVPWFYGLAPTTPLAAIAE